MSEKVHFTFFPDPEDQLYFAQATLLELGETLVAQPDIIARAIHETKRQGNGESLFMALQQCDPLSAVENNAIEDALESAISMCSEFNQPRDEARRFIIDTLGVIIRLKKGLDVSSPLDTGSQKEIADNTELMMSHVEIGIKEAKACLN